MLSDFISYIFDPPQKYLPTQLSPNQAIHFSFKNFGKPKLPKYQTSYMNGPQHSLLKLYKEESLAGKLNPTRNIVYRVVTAVTADFSSSRFSSIRGSEQQHDSLKTALASPLLPALHCLLHFSICTTTVYTHGLLQNAKSFLQKIEASPGTVKAKKQLRPLENHSAPVRTCAHAQASTQHAGVRSSSQFPCSKAERAKQRNFLNQLLMP